MTTLVLAILIASLGFAAGTGVYDSLRQRGRGMLRPALATMGWIVALRMFYLLA